MKSAGYGSPVEWHQDWAFYPHTNDDVLATGIYLDDCELDNGPLMVLPGTHHGPTRPSRRDGRFCGAMDPGQRTRFRQRGAADGPGRVDDHPSCPGGARLGTQSSNRQRRLLLYEYTAADAWPLLGFPEGWRTSTACWWPATRP